MTDKKDKVTGTLDANGQWVDANGIQLPDDVTRHWDKGDNVKYPKYIRDQMSKPKRGRKPKDPEKTQRATRWDK